MRVKKHITYTAEIDGHEFPVPFEFYDGSEILKISADGKTAKLGVLANDFNPCDPLEEYDEGEFYQFDRSYIHHSSRPDEDEFKRIVRANPGRVFTVYSTGDGYKIDDGPLTVADTKSGKTCGAIGSAAGYYIVPADVTNPADYAAAVMAQYSAFCEGDVYGVCVWEYELQGEDWELVNRDNECWGFYGYKYAMEQLRGEVQ